MKFLTNLRAVAVLFLNLVSACVKGPDFEAPAPPTAVTFRGDTPAGESIANTEWWDLYQDPALRSLIQAGLENNRTVRGSMAKIVEARAGLGIARADRSPSINGVGVGLYQETLLQDSVRSFDNVKMALSASYEVDLWGRIARSNEAALQALLATEEAFRTVTITLVSDIASAYLTLRDLVARLDLAEATLQASRASSAYSRSAPKVAWWQKSTCVAPRSTSRTSRRLGRSSCARVRRRRMC